MGLAMNSDAVAAVEQKKVTPNPLLDFHPLAAGYARHTSTLTLRREATIAFSVMSHSSSTLELSYAFPIIIHRSDIYGGFKSFPGVQKHCR